MRKTDSRTSERDAKPTENNAVENMVAEGPAEGQDITQQLVVPEEVDVTTRTRRGETLHIQAKQYRGSPSELPHPEYLRFAVALRDAMRTRKMSASEVARKVWGSTRDRRGYDVARNRDRIGHYLAGTSYPSQANLEKLAAALNLSVEDLAVTERPAENNPGPRVRPPSIALVISEVSNEPDIFRIQVDQHVDFETAQEIMQLLQKAKKTIATVRDERSRQLGQIVRGGADDDDGDGDGDRETA